VDSRSRAPRTAARARPVEAFEDGEVVYDAYDPNGGNGIIIRGSDGLYHRYFHFDSTNVSMGDRSTGAT
jgi:murein DD-endopeptidase MepM/ murein hydrolase activator NlpD